MERSVVNCSLSVSFVICGRPPDIRRYCLAHELYRAVVRDFDLISRHSSKTVNSVASCSTVNEKLLNINKAVMMDEFMILYDILLRERWKYL